ncbi:MAG: hypothetical protein U0235_27435 [Polyangiaceae bacterium]
MMARMLPGVLERCATFIPAPASTSPGPSDDPEDGLPCCPRPRRRGWFPSLPYRDRPRRSCSGRGSAGALLRGARRRSRARRGSLGNPAPSGGSSSRGALGFWFGFMCNAYTFRFVMDVIQRFTTLPWTVGALAIILLAGAHALRFFVSELVFRALASRGTHRIAAFAAAMYAGTFVPMMFPWTTGGAAMAWPVTVQLADLVGERGVVALFAVVSALFGEAIAAAVERRAPRSARRRWACSRSWAPLSSTGRSA